MSAQNLSVCFGPVFMWSPEESLAAIHDVKFQCSTVEVLIEKCDCIFASDSETKILNETIREKPFGLTKRTTSRYVDECDDDSSMTHCHVETSGFYPDHPSLAAPHPCRPPDGDKCDTEVQL